jgi:tetratricopeptide (TPR) repeat protein
MKKRFVMQTIISIVVLFFIVSCGGNKQERVHKLLMSAKEKIYRLQYDEALEDLEKVEKLNKNHPELYFLRGNVYLTKKMYDDAMTQYNKAIELDANYMEAYVNRGRLWFYLGDSDKRCEDFLKAESLGATNLYEDTKFCK